MSNLKKYAFPKKVWIEIKKFWDYVWNGNDLLSWILSILIAFIIIKFIFYPGLGLILGTSHPIVAVVSDSMHHNDSFDDWWIENYEFYHDFDISKNEFETYSFKNGFNKGDIIFLVGLKKEPEIGNVIVFESGEPYPIIHRTIRILDSENKTIYQTKGDNNEGLLYRKFDTRTGIFTNKVLDYSDVKFGVYESNTPNYIKTIIDESNVTKEQVLGRAVFRIPYLGYIKIWFVNFINWTGLTNLFISIGLVR